MVGVAAEVVCCLLGEWSNVVVAECGLWCGQSGCDELEEE